MFPKETAKRGVSFHGIGSNRTPDPGGAAGKRAYVERRTGGTDRAVGIAVFSPGKEAGTRGRHHALRGGDRPADARIHGHGRSSWSTWTSSPMPLRMNSMAAWAAEPHIVECHAMSGGHDYIMKVLARDIDHFSELIMREILKYPGRPPRRVELQPRRDQALPGIADLNGPGLHRMQDPWQAGWRRDRPRDRALQGGICVGPRARVRLGAGTKPSPSLPDLDGSAVVHRRPDEHRGGTGRVAGRVGRFVDSDGSHLAGRHLPEFRRDASDRFGRRTAGRWGGRPRLAWRGAGSFR